MDKTQVRTAADLEKKYNFSRILGFEKNIEINTQQLIKIQNELNSMLNSLIINLGDLLDSQSSISLWFYNETPTTSNEPYIHWLDPSEHYGDFYYDGSTGYVYKFTEDGWEQQYDTNLINAMALTNTELDTSQDHERQVFFDTPTPPYQSGDWWILEDGTLMICQIGKDSGEYEEYDFINSSRYTETIATMINNTLEVTRGTVAIVMANQDSIQTEVTETTTYLQGQIDGVNGDLQSYKNEVSSQFTQTSDAFTMQFTSVNELINQVASTEDTHHSELTRYIRFVNGVIILGEAGNDYTVELSNTKLSFKFQGNEVAYVSNKTLYINDAEVKEQETIGNFAFIPRSNGSLSFRKVK